MGKKLITILVLTFAYSLLRYVVFGPVDLIHTPVYLLNKSVSMTSVICLFLSLRYFGKRNPAGAKYFGIASFHTASAHILLSLSILSAAYYPKFFHVDKMNLVGELTMMFGVVAAYLYLFICPVRQGAAFPVIYQIVAVLMIGGHLVSMGLKGWLAVSQWYGGLPPISLISFIFLVACLGLLLRPQPKE
ncbi:MAG TPA: hypothetical protein VIR63_02100 [Pontiella sp.]